MNIFDAVYVQPNPVVIKETISHWTTESLENVLGWIENTNLIPVPVYAEIHEIISGELGQRQHDEHESDYIRSIAR